MGFKVLKTTTDTAYSDFLSMKSQLLIPKEITDKTSPEDTYWIQLDLQSHISNLSDLNSFYLRYNSFDHATIYMESKGKLVQEKIGKFDDDNKNVQVNYSYYDSFLKL